MKEFFKSLKKSRGDLLFNLSIIFSLLFLIFFLLIAQNILTQGLLVEIDHQVLNSIVSLRNINLTKILLFFTYLGNWQIIVSLGVILVIIFWLTRKKRLMYFLISWLAGSEIILLIFKLIFHRPRPEAKFALIPETGYSFPSGHAFISVVFYGIIGYYLFRLTKKGGQKLLIFISSFLIIFLVGLSRIYLGLHWTSDVMASWSLGLFFLILLIAIFKQKEKFASDLLKN